MSGLNPVLNSLSSPRTLFEFIISRMSTELDSLYISGSKCLSISVRNTSARRLWRHVNWFDLEWQLFKVWLSVHFSAPQSGHLPFSDLPHMTRFCGVTSVFVLPLIMNLKSLSSKYSKDLYGFDSGVMLPVKEWPVSLFPLILLINSCWKKFLINTLHDLGSLTKHSAVVPSDLS